MKSVALTIAGSDPSGGAGLQADLKTFQQHNVYGMSVVTMLTAQNTRGVESVAAVEPRFVRAQLDAVISDIPPLVAKTGALGSALIIETIVERSATWGFPLVVDPVMVSKHGDPLLDKEAAGALRKGLVPRAFLVTPNIPEASVLAEMEITDVTSMEKAAHLISLRGVPNVLVKGGRLEGQAIDVLYHDGESHRYSTPRIDTPHTHGTGCVLSAAIAARVGLGEALAAAVQGAKSFVTEAIRSAAGLGAGQGPVNTFVVVPPVPDGG